MTRDEILKMTAGPKINRIVFVNVLKMHEFDPHPVNNAMCAICGGNGTAYGHPVPNDYSGDISAAFRVLNALGDVSWSLSPCWNAETGKRAGFSMWLGGESVVAPSAPLAICYAVLLASLEDK
jgi:hypothetical protein